MIEREQTIAHLKKRLIETAINNVGVKASCDSIFAETADNRIEPWINEIPSARPKGKWLEIHIYPDTHEGHTYGTCSNCLRVRIVDNFCSNCGSDNREVE